MKKIVFLLFIGAFALSACRKDDPVDIQDNRQIVLFLSTQSTSSSLLKASTVAANLDEKRIDKVILYSVDEGGNILKIHPVIQNPKIGGEEISIPRKTKSMYAIANPSNGIIGATPSTVSDLVNLTGDFPAAPEIPLLMGGMGPVNSYSVNVELIRAVAKINIKGTNGFKIGSITVQNTPDSVYVFKRTPLAIPGHVNMLSYTKMEFYPPVTDTTLYVPENSKGDSTVFVVTGDIDNEPVEYIFSLKSGGKAIDIVRNTRYQVSINPAAEPSGTITISMPDWDEGGLVDDITDDVPSNPNPYKNGIKILAIGNSYAEDAMAYMYEQLVQLGVDENGITLVNAHYGGATLADHVNFATSGSTVYTRQSYIGNEWASSVSSQTLLSILKSENWDIITMQQASADSPYSANYTDGHIQSLITWIWNNANNHDYKLVWNMTQAWSEDFPQSVDQLWMYQNICSNVNTYIKPDNNFKIIIPTGTAIQNARGLYGDNLNRDYSHLNNLGCYIVAATWIKAITGFDIANLDTPFDAYKSGKGDSYEIDATDLAKIVQSVNNAISKPYNTTP